MQVMHWWRVLTFTSLPCLIIKSLLKGGLNLIVVPTTFESPRPVDELPNRVDGVVPNFHALLRLEDWVIVLEPVGEWEEEVSE